MKQALHEMKQLLIKTAANTEQEQASYLAKLEEMAHEKEQRGQEMEGLRAELQQERTLRKQLAAEVGQLRSQAARERDEQQT